MLLSAFNPMSMALVFDAAMGVSGMKAG